ncbi:MAG TPA: DNA primase catalytic subunit PriS [Methanolinea sp.]|jgi:DNA primase small subunit|nr:MAG: DNA primase small subunit PriS [Methanoregulaceae archaeon PtaB.Bin009]OPY42381.1 MAG: DNA primase small subunit PriS [Methanoregulaceae archaeon PtaU1.Bin066]HII76310.1 DNA primase catalytic subunit PriS [Methanolinea sp.]HNQ29697.1 DNA primase catalytic subunit PriS [Methanolinea sp.]
MKAATLEFLRQRFSSYYAKEPLLSPSSLPQREWAFVFFDPDFPDIRMRRHLGFETRDEAFSYIRSMAPAHIYYSTAYYARPGAGTMQEKEWLGADLIFDLDADHIMRGPYDRMLSRVKEETKKLLDMLVLELGFSPREIDLVFSGGRGYHVHVHDLSVRNWGSSERRELIDYVCGIGLDPGRVLAHRTHSPRGWHHRYIAALAEYLLWLESLGEKERVAAIAGLEGVGKTTAEEFSRRLGEVLSRITTDPASLNLKDAVIAKVIRGLSVQKEGQFAAMLRDRAALADEPVTTDTKRLIRLPSSLHGGSGLRVTPLAPKDLDDFDPLVDAVVFGEREVKVDLAFPLSMPILGTSFRLEKGISAVPEALAVFLCCRGAAEIAGGASSAPG